LSASALRLTGAQEVDATRALFREDEGEAHVAATKPSEPTSGSASYSKGLPH